MVEDACAAGRRAPASERAAYPAHAAARAGAGQLFRVLSRVAARGAAAIGSVRLHVSTRFPFGLVRSESRSCRTVPRCWSVRGWGSLTQRWLQIVDSRLQGSHSEGRRQGMLEGDYYGLREWRPGDSQRWIHWRTSAKLGELAVRQFEQQRNRDLILVLDLWEPDSPTEQELLQTEIAISFLATAVSRFRPARWQPRRDQCGRS